MLWRGYSRGFSNLQPKAPAPMMRMEDGGDSPGDLGELGEDMLDYADGT